ncbi:MAG TPA: lantibiotic immunity ABC transporter MutE/EpiE family permease subunit [Firmicutes bacterium]|nr:lantibiotic immunity ABC transporter MutE/EpiE family permease subunit [Bacillota bacterium]
MNSLTKTEHLKFKRTFTKKLLLTAPLFFLAVALLQRCFMPSEYAHSWAMVLALLYNWWPVLFVPLGSALLATLVTSQEKRAGGYRAVLIHPISPACVWVAKIAVLVYHMLLTTLVLMGTTLAFGYITATGPVPWREILAGGLLLWIAALPQISIQLWAAQAFGTFACIVLGVAGLVGGVVAAQTPYWVYLPWSWPTRLMCPLIGVHPNGTLLPPADPLRSPTAIPMGVGLAIACLVVTSLGSAVWFRGLDVR